MATRCSTNPPLRLTARYTSISFQRCSQLSFAVAMISRSIHFRCCAMRIRAIPSPFQRKTALRVSVAIYALPYFALPLPGSARLSKSFASRHQPPPRPCVSVRGDSLLCHSISIHSGARPCHCFSGRIEATHFDAQPSRVTASQYFAFTEQNMSKPLHFSATPISAFPLRC